jgi:hypothetical protein
LKAEKRKSFGAEIWPLYYTAECLGYFDVKIRKWQYLIPTASNEQNNATLLFSIIN